MDGTSGQGCKAATGNRDVHQAEGNHQAEGLAGKLPKDQGSIPFTSCQAQRAKSHPYLWRDRKWVEEPQGDRGRGDRRKQGAGEGLSPSSLQGHKSHGAGQGRTL